MEVASADPGAGDLDDDAIGRRRIGIRYLLALDVFGATVDQSLHEEASTPARAPMQARLGLSAAGPGFAEVHFTHWTGAVLAGYGLS